MVARRSGTITCGDAASTHGQYVLGAARGKGVCAAGLGSAGDEPFYALLRARGARAHAGQVVFMMIDWLRRLCGRPRRLDPPKCDAKVPSMPPAALQALPKAHLARFEAESKEVNSHICGRNGLK